MNRAGKLLGASILTIIAAFQAGYPGSAGAAQADVQTGSADLAWQKEFDTWRAAAKSGKLDDYRNYLKLYPAGKFANVAKRRIEKMGADSTTGKADVVAEPVKAAEIAKPDDQSGTVATRQMDLPKKLDSAVSEATPGADKPTATTAKAEAKPAAGATAEDADYQAWKKAAGGNTAKTYQDYLAGHPDGKFATLAKARIVQLEADLKPESATEKPASAIEKDESSVVNVQLPPKGDEGKPAVSVEKPDVASVTTKNDLQGADEETVAEQPQQPAGDRVALSAAGRREIQGRLSALGYDTVGADGAFGPRTRAAIRKWQVDNKFAADGFLDETQVAKLKAQSRTAYQRWQLAENQRLADEQMALQRKRYVRDNRDNAVLVRPRSDRPLYSLDGELDPEAGGPVTVIRRVDPYRDRGYREYRRPRYMVCDDFGFCE